MKSDDVILSQKRWEKLYKKSSIDSKGNYKKDKTVLSYKKFLNKYKNKYKKGVFLDLGCGIAWTAALMAAEGVSVIGVDISSDAINKSKEIFKSENLKGKFFQADLLHLPLKDKSVDFIYSCMSLEYVRDTQKAVSECYRVLNTHGTIVAIVPVISLTTLTYHQLRGDIPNIPIIKSLAEMVHLKLLKAKYMHYGYEQSFRVEQLRGMFEKAGFHVNKIDFFDMHYPVEFVPSVIRPYAQKLLKFRPFWPLVYIEAKKL